LTEPEPSVSQEKEQLRNYVVRLRDRLSSLEVEEKSGDILDQIIRLREYSQAKGIASYVSKDSEVSTRKLIRTALDQRKRVLVPIVKREKVELAFSEINNLGNELEPGSFGILEPKPEFRRPADLDSIDVLFVPGIAWDKTGYRIGWGRGYFDRTLKTLPNHVYAIGLGFDLQVISRIPRGQFDVPVKMIITESRIIRCQG
jgi:5-formyltetrahydrofolate cyclo-ligase